MLTCEQKEESLSYGPPSGSSSAIPSLEAVIPSLCADSNQPALKENKCDTVEDELNYFPSEDKCPPVSTGTLFIIYLFYI